MQSLQQLLSARVDIHTVAVDLFQQDAHGGWRGLVSVRAVCPAPHPFKDSLLVSGCSNESDRGCLMLVHPADQPGRPPEEVLLPGPDCCQRHMRNIYGVCCSVVEGWLYAVDMANDQVLEFRLQQRVEVKPGQHRVQAVCFNRIDLPRGFQVCGGVV